MAAYPPASFRRSYSAGAHVTAPASFRAPCLLGIDEAGRGPVSGMRASFPARESERIRPESGLKWSGSGAESRRIRGA